jgi:hypothetical protein
VLPSSHFREATQFHCWSSEELHHFVVPIVVRIAPPEERVGWKEHWWTCEKERLIPQTPEKENHPMKPSHRRVKTSRVAVDFLSDLEPAGQWHEMLLMKSLSWPVFLSPMATVEPSEYESEHSTWLLLIHQQTRHR